MDGKNKTKSSDIYSTGVVHCWVRWFWDKKSGKPLFMGVAGLFGEKVEKISEIAGNALCIRASGNF